MKGADPWSWLEWACTISQEAGGEKKWTWGSNSQKESRRFDSSQPKRNSRLTRRNKGAASPLDWVLRKAQMKEGNHDKGNEEEWLEAAEEEKEQPEAGRWKEEVLHEVAAQKTLQQRKINAWRREQKKTKSEAYKLCKPISLVPNSASTETKTLQQVTNRWWRMKMKEEQTRK